MTVLFMTVIDAKGMVAGRIATQIAKELIRGEKVIVLNAEEAIVVGNTQSIMEKYKRRVDAAVKSNPHYGPKYSRVPSRMFKKMVRNMLPTTKRAKERIVKNLKVYNATPKELRSEKVTGYSDAKFGGRGRSMTMKEIALQLGGKW